MDLILKSLFFSACTDCDRLERAVDGFRFLRGFRDQSLQPGGPALPRGLLLGQRSHLLLDVVNPGPGLLRPQGGRALRLRLLQRRPPGELAVAGLVLVGHPEGAALERDVLVQGPPGGVVNADGVEDFLLPLNQPLRADVVDGAL